MVSGTFWGNNLDPSVRLSNNLSSSSTLSLRREQAGCACPSWALWLGAAGLPWACHPEHWAALQDDSRHRHQGCPQHSTVRVLSPPGRFRAEGAQ